VQQRYERYEIVLARSHFWAQVDVRQKREELIREGVERQLHYLNHYLNRSQHLSHLLPYARHLQRRLSIDYLPIRD
jgi:hypothetical protein